MAEVSSAGLDYASVLEYGRKVGGPALRKMTFQERGRMLKALALHLNGLKKKFYELSWATGATKVDSWIDIEGGFGNLFTNASLRRQFPDLPYHVDGDVVGLSKGGSFIGHHIMVPKRGVAVHINAFNFPVWGMLEKSGGELDGRCTVCSKTFRIHLLLNGIGCTGDHQLEDPSGRGLAAH